MRYAQGRIARMIENYGDGETLTLRRTSSFSTSRSTVALAVSGTTALGSSSITFGQAGTSGILLSGATFTIAGDGTTYTSTADAEAAQSGFVTVSITPVLAAEAADGAAVTIVSKSTDYTLARMRDEIATQQDAESLRGDRRRYHVSAEGATVEPRPGDLVIDGAKTDRVLRAMPLSPGSDNLCFTLIVGDAA